MRPPCCWRWREPRTGRRSIGGSACLNCCGSSQDRRRRLGAVRDLGGGAVRYGPGPAGAGPLPEGGGSKRTHRSRASLPDRDAGEGGELARDDAAGRSGQLRPAHRDHRMGACRRCSRWTLLRTVAKRSLHVNGTCTVFVSTRRSTGRNTSTSNGRAMLLPAGSSRTVSTTSLYAPARHAAFGVNRQRVSSSVTAMVPSTSFPSGAGHPEDALQHGVVERLGERHHQRLRLAGGRCLHLPRFRVGLRLVGSGDAELLAIGFLQRFAVRRRANCGQSPACKSCLPPALGPTPRAAPGRA